MSTGYYSDRQASRRRDRKIDTNFARAVIDLVGPDASITDLGASVGNYVNFWRANGLGAIGYDGTPSIVQLSGGVVLNVDLAKNDRILSCADWCVSLEVGEHIPEEFESAFLKNIVDCSRVGAIVSWAKPGQRGSGHVNCRSRRYLRRKFADRGLQYSGDETRRLMDAATFGYLKKNVQVFRRK